MLSIVTYCIDYRPEKHGVKALRYQWIPLFSNIIMQKKIASTIQQKQYAIARTNDSTITTKKAN